MSAESDRIEDAQKAMQTAIEEADLKQQEELQKRAAELQKQFAEERVAQARRDLDFQLEVQAAAEKEIEAEKKAAAEASDEDSERRDTEDKIAAATSETIAEVRVKEGSSEEGELVVPGESSLPEGRQVKEGEAPKAKAGRPNAVSSQ